MVSDAHDREQPRKKRLPPLSKLALSRAQISSRKHPAISPTASPRISLAASDFRNMRADRKKVRIGLRVVTMSPPPEAMPCFSPMNINSLYATMQRAPKAAKAKALGLIFQGRRRKIIMGMNDMKVSRKRQKANTSGAPVAASALAEGQLPPHMVMARSMSSVR